MAEFGMVMPGQPAANEAPCSASNDLSFGMYAMEAASRSSVKVKTMLGRLGAGDEDVGFSDGVGLDAGAASRGLAPADKTISKPATKAQAARQSELRDMVTSCVLEYSETRASPAAGHIVTDDCDAGTSHV